jgi:hypothetical protein
VTGELDGAWHLVGRGASIVSLELPAPVGPVATGDAAVADTIVRAIARLFAREAMVEVVEPDASGRLVRRARPVRGQDIAVVTAFREQAAAVQLRLRTYLPHDVSAQVIVQTANALQGLERPLVVVWHPLSGLQAISPFVVDPGRFCVALTRHSVGCLVVGRAGVLDQLDRAPQGPTVPVGVEDDPYLTGLSAHRAILQRLHALNRAVAVAA